MKPSILALLPMLFVLSGAVLPACAGTMTTHHVSAVYGDDANSGADWASAWATLPFAVAKASSGDTILVSNGVYRLSASVVLSKAITLTSLGAAEQTVLDGRGAHTGVIIAHPAAVVEGLTIRNGYGNPGGVRIDAGTLRRSTVEANITGSHADHTFVGGIRATGTQSRIEQCRILGNRGGRWGVGGVALDEGALLRNSLVAGNWVLGDGGNAPGGITVSRGGRIESCTVVGNDSPNVNGIGGIQAGQGIVHLRNSIVRFNRGRLANDLGGNGQFAQSTHNLVGNLDRGLDAATNHIGDPRFAAPGAEFGMEHVTGDYRVVPGSPAIGTGTMQDWMADATDLAERPRTTGESVDIGAYAFPLGALTAVIRVAPYDGVVGETEIAVSAGVAGRNTEGLHFAWDFENDGVIDQEGPESDVVHTFHQAGLKTVRLMVRNAAGEQTEALAENTVRIGPRAVFLARAGQTPVFPHATWETATDDLQTAVDTAVAGSTIHVGPGIHAPDATVTLDRAITLEGSEGARETYLDGRGRIRCIRLNHPEAILREITVMNDGADTVMDFGAVGDGETNDAPAIRRALETAMGGTLVFPPGRYRIETSFGVTLSDHLTLRGTPGETILLFSRDHTMTFRSPSPGRRSLAADVTRGDTVLSLDAIDGLEPGDLINVSDRTVRERGWNRPGAHLSYVTTVDAENGTIAIAHPLNFDFTVEAGARAGFSRPRGKLWIEGFDLVVGDPDREWSQPMLSFHGLKGAEVHQLRFFGVRRHGHNAMSISGCLDTVFRNLFFDKIVYGVTVGNSRNTHFEQIECYNSRHPVVPASWSDGITVDGLRGDNNTGIMDAHPAFNIHYNNVHSGIEHSGASNLRSVGGSIRNSTFITRDTFRYGPYFQSVALVNPEIYREYDFLMENVHWEAWRPIAIGHGGTVTLRNVRCVDPAGQELGINVGRGVERLVLDNTKPGNIAVADVAVMGENRLDAEPGPLAWTDDAGVEQGSEDGYVLDFQHNLLSRQRCQLRAHGQIFTGRTDEPVATTLRILDTFTGRSAYPQSVYGILKLKAILTHANVGGWQILEQHYHFNHKRVQTRGLAFQTTPVYVSEPAGQPNATLEMTLANPRHDAPHAADADRWFQVDLQLRSGRTRPEYRLYYEIELYGQ